MLIKCCASSWSTAGLCDGDLIVVIGAGCFTFRCSRLWADLRWGHLDEDVGVRLLVLVVVFVQCLVHCSLFRGLNSEVLFLPCGLMMGVHLGVDTISMLFVMLVAFWMARLLLVLLNCLRMGIFFCFLRGCSVFGGWTRFVL